MARTTSSSLRGVLRIPLLGAALGLSLMAEGTPIEGLGGLKVERRVFPVTLPDGGRYDLVGYLYHRGSPRKRPLQVLLHGTTYDHGYWDFPAINGRDYSYIRFMARRGYALLAIDLPGSGESDRPPGDVVTLAALGDAIHQVMVQLRAGASGPGHGFRRVALVGHSLGSQVATWTQAVHGDADALVTTAMGHVPHPLPIPPALFQDWARFPYFGLGPELRAQLMYSLPDVDAEVVAYDSGHNTGQIPRGVLLTAMAGTFDPSVTRVGEVTGPVLVQLGEHDLLFPATYAAAEAAQWPSASCVTVQSLPNMGHAFNLHLGHEAGWRQIDAWLAAKLGR